LAIPVWAIVPSRLEIVGLPLAAAFGMAGLIFVIAVLTDYPLGLVRVIPFPIHGWIDRLGAPLVVAAPWLAGFSGDTTAWNFYVAMGSYALLVTILTDFRSRGAGRPSSKARGAAYREGGPGGDTENPPALMQHRALRSSHVLHGRAAW
jgi:hypothetical protein